jgi:hypothetical protein
MQHPPRPESGRQLQANPTYAIYTPTCATYNLTCVTS